MPLKYLLVSFLTLCTVWVMAQPGNIFFGADTVHEIRINFQLANYWDSLTYYKTLDDASGIEKYVHADIVIDGDSVDQVGIRLRGNSSYTHPGTKKPVQIDFNEFVHGQKYDGMKKLNLNNSYLDPTHLREKIYLDVLNEMGIAAPRCSYAAVYFNNDYTGLYKTIEPVTKDFLEAHFDNDTGNLYKCEPNMPLTWEGSDQSTYYDNCELKTNETENDWSNLVRFINVINYTDVSQYEPALRNILQVDAYLRTWAANMVFGNLDAYLYLPHNYYLYENPATGKIDWITWDVSLAFGVYAVLVNPQSNTFDIEYLPNNSQNTRPLNDRCLKNQSLRTQYLADVCQIASQVFTPANLFPRIDSLANVIRTYVYNEPLTNKMFTNDEFERNIQYGNVSYQTLGTVPGLKDFIQSRRSSIFKQLCDKKLGCANGSIMPILNDVTIYPNPGSVFNISFAMPSPSEMVTYTITDAMGRSVITQTLQNDPGGVQLLDLSYLPNGVYLVKTNSGCIEKEKRIVVMH